MMTIVTGLNEVKAARSQSRAQKDALSPARLELTLYVPHNYVRHLGTRIGSVRLSGTPHSLATVAVLSLQAEPGLLFVYE